MTTMNAVLKPRRARRAELEQLIPKRLHFEIDEWAQQYPNTAEFYVVDGPVETALDISLTECSIVVIKGALKCRHAEFDTDGYEPACIVVLGDLDAHSLHFASGSRVHITGALTVETYLFGQYGDRNAVLEANDITAQAVLLEKSASVWAQRHLRASLFAEMGVYETLVPDFVNSGEGDDDRFFVEDVLDPKMKKARFVDFARAIAATREDRPVFKPGVLPAKLPAPRRTK